MKQKFCLFAIHQTATSIQRTNNLNPRTIWYPALDESNRMKSAYFTIHPGKNPPPQNGCRLKSVFFIKSAYTTSSTFPIQPDFSQNQPAAITLNTGSPRTLPPGRWPHALRHSLRRRDAPRRQAGHGHRRAALGERGRSVGEGVL